MVTLNKKMRRIKEAIADKTEQAKSYLDGESKDVDKATALLDEVDELKKEYTAEEKLFRLEQEEAESKSGKQIEEKKQLNSTEKFASVIRGMVRKDGTVTPMTEGVNANGGRIFRQKSCTSRRLISLLRSTFPRRPLPPTAAEGPSRQRQPAQALPRSTKPALPLLSHRLHICPFLTQSPTRRALFR